MEVPRLQWLFTRCGECVDDSRVMNCLDAALNFVLTGGCADNCVDACVSEYVDDCGDDCVRECVEDCVFKITSRTVLMIMARSECV